MDLFDRIEQLAESSRHLEPPTVDVADRVNRTIRVQQKDTPPLVDFHALAFAGASLAVTGVAALMFSPLLLKLWDPWTAYMNAPWSL